MFRCFSFLGLAALAFGVAALASATKPSSTPQLPVVRRRPRRPAQFVRVPGLAFHVALSAN
jgi:hypothetical protein